ncbi:hypothetical protein ACOSQ2_031312 [Xanthoceras sorbifolium]
MGLFKRPNTLVWHFDEKKRIYSVKSGQVAMRDHIRSCSSSSLSSHSWWSLLWNLIIPPKIKIFLWRMCHDALPSLSNLFFRKIVQDPSCKRCGLGPKTIAHALF